MTFCGRVGLSLTGHSSLAPSCDLVHLRQCWQNKALLDPEVHQTTESNRSGKFHSVHLIADEI